MINYRLNKKHLRYTLILILVTIGGVLFGKGSYIYAKALLAQYLIQQSWEQTLTQNTPVKPWSWSDTWPVARLMIPKHGVDLIVLAGDSGRTLAFGPGHQSGSVFPGQTGNSVISAHRDTHFDFIAELHVGDEIIVQNHTGALQHYRVIEAQILDSREAGLSVDYPKSLLSLVTCYPFDAVAAGGPMRYVVFAEQVKSFYI